MGQVLNGTVVQGGHNKKSKVIADDFATTLPNWVSRNLSSADQLLAKAPKRWFDKVIAEMGTLESLKAPVDTRPRHRRARERVMSWPHTRLPARLFAYE